MSTKIAENQLNNPPANSFNIKELAARLKFARKSLKISGEEMAKKAGVAQTTISWWETAKGEPPYAYLAMLAHEYGYNLNWLILGNGEPKKSQSDVNNVKELELLRKNAQMSEALLKKDQLIERKDNLLEIVITALVKGGLADSIPQEMIAQYAHSWGKSPEKDSK